MTALLSEPALRAPFVLSSSHLLTPPHFPLTATSESIKGHHYIGRSNQPNVTHKR